MIMRSSTIATALCASALIAGCASDGTFGDNGKTVGGATLGALLGGVAGAATTHGNAGATIVGALAGGLIGGAIGAQLDERDRRMRDAALAASLESRRDVVREWRNPETGNSGVIKPLSGYTKTANAQVCRDFNESYTKDGTTRTEQSRACRDTDGKWKIVHA